jgi:hypothetical protein
MNLKLRVLSIAVLVVYSAVAAGAQRKSQAESTEWISLCSKCLSPSVASKSGFGTANAVAEGKVTLADAKQWCASWEPDSKACPKEQLTNEKDQAYRVSANCKAGKLTSFDGLSYTYAGVWNNDDIGGGRPKFRGSDGKIVGRDNASGGLTLAANWELLCSTAVPGKAAVMPASVAATRTVDACSGKQHCDSNRAFSAEILQLSDAFVGNTRHHLVKLNVRFTNLTDRPLTLGYVNYTSSMTDNLGNAYIWGRPGTHDISAQGIGVVERRSANAQFVLSPGESRNALFQVVRYNAGRNATGRSFNYNVTIAELERSAANQVRSRNQYSMSFPQLTLGR